MSAETCPTNDATSTNNASSSSAEVLTETAILQQTCAVYGSASLALFVAFLIVRPLFPRVYNPKKAFPAHRVALADDPFGRLSWTWRVFGASYDDIREQCGMDAVTTVRMLEFGAKASLVCVFNSTFLFCAYAFLGDAVRNDPVRELSLSNLDQGSRGTVATAVAAYAFFGAAMYFVRKDLDWFTTHRHKHLSEQRVRNYSVFLANLPPEMQANRAVREYYEKFFHRDAIVDAQVSLNVPNLEKEVAKRKKLLAKLEHAMNVKKVKGVTPRHKTKLCGGEKVESIPAYEKDLDELNEAIQTMCNDMMGGGATSSGEDVETAMSICERRAKTEADKAPRGEGSTFAKYLIDPASSPPRLANAPTSRDREAAIPLDPVQGAAKLKAVILGGEDGSPRNAAFVTFDSLSSASIVRQTLHQREPWSCVPSEPPNPECVNWKNVGKNHKSKKIGGLISFALTVALCIFWTIPVGFVASLSNVQSLTKLLPFLQYPVDNYEWFSDVLALLAPLILVVFISLVPYILLAIIKFEGLIEIENMQHPSLFTKLASFTLIQTFFISTIASTLFSSLQCILNNPASAFRIVAVALPSQAGYFIQIIFVQNLPALGIELLRVSAVAQNIARKIAVKIMGHNVTDMERNETFMGLRSLDNPLGYEYARQIGSKVILAQMVLFVYGCMSPITAYFTLLVFLFLSIGFRNQILFVYPPISDSGGKLWIDFTKISIGCMVVAELILLAVLLLKEALIASAMMAPLIASTILFDRYLKRRHYYITWYLPMDECAYADSINESSGATCESFKGAYLQPAIKDSSPAFPEIGSSSESGSVHKAAAVGTEPDCDQHLMKQTLNLKEDSMQSQQKCTQDNLESAGTGDDNKSERANEGGSRDDIAKSHSSISEDRTGFFSCESKGIQVGSNDEVNTATK
ncbi:hypothetical protein ACHAWF_007273 [Thalassiosira exigua]